MKTAKEYVNENYNFDKHGLAECSDVYIMKSHEDFSSLQNRSLVEENERLKAYLKDRVPYLKGIEMDYFNKSEGVLKQFYRQCSKDFENRRGELELLIAEFPALSYKEEKKNG